MAFQWNFFLFLSLFFSLSPPSLPPCLYVYRCTCAHVCMCSQRWISGVLLSHFAPYPLSKGDSMNLELTELRQLTLVSPRAPPISVFPAMRLQAHTIHVDFFFFFFLWVLETKVFMLAQQAFHPLRLCLSSSFRSLALFEMTFSSRLYERGY